MYGTWSAIPVLLAAPFHLPLRLLVQVLMRLLTLSRVQVALVTLVTAAATRLRAPVRPTVRLWLIEPSLASEPGTGSIVASDPALMPVGRSLR